MITFVLVVVVVEKLIKIVERFNSFAEQTEESRCLKSINFGSKCNCVFNFYEKDKLSWFFKVCLILKMPYKADILYYVRTGKIQGEVFKL